MRFTVISTAPTLLKNGQIVAYTPYVNEMNLWFKNVDEITIVSPTEYSKPLLTEAFENQNIHLKSIPSISIQGLKNKFISLIKLPRILTLLYREMQKADHIHLRLPGNIGLMGSFLQLFFPSTPKSAKYAGNWDPNSKQPWSYRLQKWIVSNPFLTRNMKVLVYGEWENQSANVVPFFTATYRESEIITVPVRDVSKEINLIFVGTLGTNKRPLLAIQVAEALHQKGIEVRLELYGDGIEKVALQNYIDSHQLENIVFLMGNQNAETLQKAYQKSHFLIFASQSEGWPKVVAEAMLWKCLPITTSVSCVPYMLGEGQRGSLVAPNVSEIVNEIENYRNQPLVYQNKCEAAYQWSHVYTLEKFESEIAKILKHA